MADYSRASGDTTVMPENKMAMSDVVSMPAHGLSALRSYRESSGALDQMRMAGKTVH